MKIVEMKNSLCMLKGVIISIFARNIFYDFESGGNLGSIIMLRFEHSNTKCSTHPLAANMMAVRNGKLFGNNQFKNAT